MGDSLYTKIGILGLIYGKNGELVTRYSDAPCYFAGANPWDWCDHCIRDESFTEYNNVPDGYISQLNLPPGEFLVKVVVTDGDKFGQIEVPLSVESYDRNSLAISSIVICKRYHAVLPRAKQYTQLISKMYEYMPAADTLFLKQEPVIPFFSGERTSSGEERRC